MGGLFSTEVEHNASVSGGTTNYLHGGAPHKIQIVGNSTHELNVSANPFLFNLTFNVSERLALVIVFVAILVSARVGIGIGVGASVRRGWVSQIKRVFAAALATIVIAALYTAMSEYRLSPSDVLANARVCGTDIVVKGPARQTDDSTNWAFRHAVPMYVGAVATRRGYFFDRTAYGECRLLGPDANHWSIAACDLNTHVPADDECRREHQLNYRSVEAFDAGYDHLPRLFVDQSGDGAIDYCRCVGGNPPDAVWACMLGGETGFGDPLGLTFAATHALSRAYCNAQTEPIIPGAGICGTAMQPASTASRDAPVWDPGYQHPSPQYEGFIASRNGRTVTGHCRVVGPSPSELWVACDLNTHVPRDDHCRRVHQYDYRSVIRFDPGYTYMSRGFIDQNRDGFVDYCRCVGGGPNLPIHWACMLGAETGFRGDNVYALTFSHTHELSLRYCRR